VFARFFVSRFKRDERKRQNGLVVSSIIQLSKVIMMTLNIDYLEHLLFYRNTISTNNVS
jgi:hypothetical protein